MSPSERDPRDWPQVGNESRRGGSRSMSPRERDTLDARRVPQSRPGDPRPLRGTGPSPARRRRRCRSAGRWATEIARLPTTPASATRTSTGRSRTPGRGTSATRTRSTAKKSTAKKSTAKKSTAPEVHEARGRRQEGRGDAEAEDLGRPQGHGEEVTARSGKSTARKSTKRVAAGKKAAATRKRKTTAARKSTAKKSTARKSTARKSTARKSTKRVAAGKKAAATRKRKTRPPARSTAKKSTARKSTAKKSTARKSDEARGRREEGRGDEEAEDDGRPKGALAQHSLTEGPTPAAVR